MGYFFVPYSKVLCDYKNTYIMKLKTNLILVLSTLLFISCDCFLGIGPECDDPEEETTGALANEFNVIIQDVKTFNNSTDIPTNSNTIEVYFKLNDIQDNPVPNRTESFFEIFEKTSEDNEFNLISVNEANRTIDPDRADFKYFNTIVLDLSGSVIADEVGLNLLKNATTKFINTIYSQITAENLLTSIIWFDGTENITVLQDFTSDQGLLVSQVETISADLPSDSSTNLNGAIVQSLSYLRTNMNSQAANFIVSGSLLIFTDGTDQANEVSTSAALNAVEQAKATVNLYSVGLGSEIDSDVLNAVGYSGAFFADNINALETEFLVVAQQIEDQANSYYLMRYCSPKRNGNNEVKIGIKNKGSQGGIATFNAANFEDNCTIN